LPTMGRYINWKPLHRGMRLAASALVTKLLPADTGVICRVVAGRKKPADLVSWLRLRRGETGGVNRYREERYLLALEAYRKAAGQPKISDPDLYQFRRDGIGLDAESALLAIWEQCVARWHARDPRDIPRSVKVIVTGAQNLEAIEEDVAVLLAEDAYLRRRRALPADRFPNLREDVIRQWVVASGGIQRHLDVVERMLGRDKDHRLAELAAEGGYARLAPDMVDVARQLAHAVAPGDAVLAFYVFRVLQRVAACTVDGEAMWRATWLRGEKTDPKAIPGTSARQTPINEVLKTRVFEEEVAKGHSGAAAIAATYRLKLTITLGACDHRAAAQVLDVVLNSKGMPRRSGR
jgi:hypothetical protein